jgi:hypothetical protein
MRTFSSDTDSESRTTLSPLWTSHIDHGYPLLAPRIQCLVAVQTALYRFVSACIWDYLDSLNGVTRMNFAWSRSRSWADTMCQARVALFLARSNDPCTLIRRGPCDRFSGTLCNLPTIGVGIGLGEVCAYTCRQTGVRYRPGITHAGNSFFRAVEFLQMDSSGWCVAISVPDVQPSHIMTLAHRRLPSPPHPQLPFFTSS